MSGTYKVNGDKLTGLTVYSTLPIGTPMAWLSDNLPVGFLKFDGAEYNQSDYPELYAIVQNIPAFQSETVGKFKIPDLSGRVLQGADSVIGALLEAGLPNIKGSVAFGFTGGTYSKLNNAIGAFSANETPQQAEQRGSGGTTAVDATADFDASQSNPIYKDDCDTVQPPAFTVNWIIKAVDYVSLPQNAIDDEHTTTGNAWSASKTKTEIDKKVEYSSEETVIGTWIDGKPIYRKVFVLSTPINVANLWTVLKVKENEDLILRGRWFSNTTVYDKDNFSGEFTEISNDSRSGNIQAFNKSLSEPASVYMYILEYTKTTD